MKRTTGGLILVLSLVATIAGLDLLAAALPSLSPGSKPEERVVIAEVIADHTGQLLMLLASLGTAAILMRQQGGHFFDDDDDKGEMP